MADELKEGFQPGLSPERFTADEGAIRMMGPKPMRTVNNVSIEQQVENDEHDEAIRQAREEAMKEG